jgi:hypothetical protein
MQISGHMLRHQLIETNEAAKGVGIVRRLRYSGAGRLGNLHHRSRAKRLIMSSAPSSGFTRLGVETS